MKTKTRIFIAMAMLPISIFCFGKAEEFAKYHARFSWLPSFVAVVAAVTIISVLAVPFVKKMAQRTDVVNFRK